MSEYRRHRSICDPMLEEDYLSDEGQSVKRLLDYLDILYTERQQRQRIAECRAWLPSVRHKRVYDAVLKGERLIDIVKLVKCGYRHVKRLFGQIITIIEKNTIAPHPPSSPNKVRGAMITAVPHP